MAYAWLDIYLHYLILVSGINLKLAGLCKFIPTDTGHRDARLTLTSKQATATLSVNGSKARSCHHVSTVPDAKPTANFQRVVSNQTLVLYYYTTVAYVSGLLRRD